MAFLNARPEAGWTSRRVSQSEHMMSMDRLVAARHPPAPQCPLGQPEAPEKPGRHPWRSH